MLRRRLSSLSSRQPRFISPRTKARLAEKQRVLKTQTDLRSQFSPNQDVAQFSKKPKLKSHSRATMRIPVGVGFFRTLKWIFFGR